MQFQKSLALFNDNSYENVLCLCWSSQTEEKLQR